MELTPEEKERLSWEVGTIVGHFWRKVVDAVNKYIASGQFYPQLMENFWDIAPSDITVVLTSISPSDIEFHLLERHIWVHYSAHVIIEGVRGEGEWFSLLLLATHKVFFEYHEGKGGRCCSTRLLPFGGDAVLTCSGVDCIQFYIQTFLFLLPNTMEKNCYLSPLSLKNT